MKGSMDRVQRGGPWTGSTGVVHGPGVHVLHTSWEYGVRCGQNYTDGKNRLKT